MDQHPPPETPDSRGGPAAGGLGWVGGGVVLLQMHQGRGAERSCYNTQTINA